MLALDFNISLGSRNIYMGRLAEASTGCKFYPLDVASRDSVSNVFSEIKPEIVIHAAASKFVDTSENHPLECFATNITGSMNIINACKEFDVKLAIAISTDKAASPANSVYGVSKLAMEHLFQKTGKANLNSYICVRFGNLAWSTGSVLPIWKEMLDKTGVIQTTGYNMRRFFMSVSDAVVTIRYVIENHGNLRSSVVVPIMSWAKVSDLLEAFVAKYGGKFEHVMPRPGEASEEVLISEKELEFARVIETPLGPSFLITHGIRGSELKTENPSISSGVNYTELSREQIDRLILERPK
jgi:UDP-N-acetylglucosamine 4,6-dehydratase